MNASSLNNINFHAPTRVVFGAGTLSRLPELVEELGGPRSKVFLVTGSNYLRSQGTLDRVLKDLEGSQVTHYDSTPPFPSPIDVDRALDRCRQVGPNLVVAIGGGSALDLGKLVAILFNNPGFAEEYGKGYRKIGNVGLPFIAVPTTSGSSSEVTAAARMWQMDERASFAVSHRTMFPAVALVDPNLAMSMPQDLAAATGMDAFTSAIESYWSKESQPMTDALALRVISLYSQNLVPSCVEGDREARTSCSLAATISGVGYTNSRPNICHAFSQPLTLLWRVPHGQAVCVSLPACLEWNAEAIPEKLPALWDALGVDGLDHAKQRLTEIMLACGLETRLGPMGVVQKDLDIMLEYVPWERLANIPKPMSKEDARSVLEGLL